MLLVLSVLVSTIWLPKVFSKKGGVEVSAVVVVVAEVVVVVVTEVSMVVVVNSCGLGFSNCEPECQCSGVRA